MEIGDGKNIEIDLIFTAPPGDGKHSIWIGISTISEIEKIDVNNHVTEDIELLSPTKETRDPTLFIIIGIGVLILVIGAVLYVWKFGLPISPPPSGEEMEEQPAQSVLDDVSEPAAQDLDETPLDEAPIIEMSLDVAPPEPETEQEALEVTEEVVIAEVFEPAEISTIGSGPPSDGMEPPIDDEDGEGLIPEV